MTSFTVATIRRFVSNCRISPNSGLGYVTGTGAKNIVENLGANSEAWRWGLRVTPVLGFIAVILLLTLVSEPPRGEIEGGDHLQATSFWSDLKYLATK